MTSTHFAKTLWLALFAGLLGSLALAFCGFYVAKADTSLFNESSQVIIAREGNRTILTMANDFKGDVSEFAVVVPIPYVFTQDQIQVGDPLIFERLDAYSSPRLVEYFDANPCMDYMFRQELLAVPESAVADEEDAAGERARALGVTIEEQFTVGEYDILMLGAEEAAGLETWLLENGYQLPEGASEVLAPYLAMDMKFFVARVNLEIFDASGFQHLRPLMMAFESDMFMLPIQLGKLNASGPQDLVAYLLSPEGRIELANYRTVNMPSNITVPEFVEEEFGEVYSAIFTRATEREVQDVAMLEYAWDMSWCDPCAADPLSPEELLAAGVFWLQQNSDFQAPNVYLTRLHLRYTSDSFAEDLMFKVTPNRENFQGRYIIQRPFDGAITCESGQAYIKEVRERQMREAEQLANLTGWRLSSIRARMDAYDPLVELPSWWQRVFERVQQR